MKSKLIFLLCFSLVTILGVQQCGQKSRGEMDQLTIHYHRYDGNYTDWKLWTWVDDSNREVLADAKDKFGLIFRIDLAQYPPKGALYFLPKYREWERKDAPERSWNRKMNNEIWVLQGNATLFSEPPSTEPFVRKAFLEKPDEIVAIVSKPIAQSAVAELAPQLRLESGDRIQVGNAALVKDGIEAGYAVRLLLDGPVKPSQLPGTVSLRGYKAGAIYLRGILDGPEYQTEAELGVWPDLERTRFAVFAPGARKVTLNAYRKATGGKARKYELSPGKGGLWQMTVDKDLSGFYYTYQVEGPTPAYSPEKELIDPYARCVTVHDGRAFIFSDQTPIAESPDFPLQEAVIYEMHVRDFSISDDSGADKRGKYLGFVEKGTRLPGSDIKTTIDHLEELGVNTVQLMPIQDFEHDPSANNYFWGYMTVNFNSPDGWFATEIEDASRVREFKTLVDELHKRGIKVVLDVVYNHTAEGNSAIQYNFNGFIPNYYYRQHVDGGYWNGSGTGNEMRAENPMVRRFIIESLIYWIEEYKIDGYRFDLMGLFDMTTMREIVARLRAVKPDIFLYGEPWAAGATPIEVTDKGKQRSEGFSVFNDHFRDALKGPWYNTDPGYVQTGRNAEAVRTGIRGAIDDFADDPVESINYVACHDGRTLWDQLVASTEWDSSLTDTQLKAMNKLAAAILFTSQGVPFMHGGQEFLRTKFGSHNSYNQPDSVNKIRWEFKREHADIFEYYRGLIQLRNEHPLFRLKSAAEVRRNLRFFEEINLNVPADCIAYFLQNNHCGDSWNDIIVLINPRHSAESFPLPAGQWNLVVDDSTAGVRTLRTVKDKSITVKAISVAVLYR